MKNLIFILLVTSLTACAQKKSENMKTSQDIYTIEKEIKHFDNEPQYGAYISTNNCSFDILINGMPVIKHMDTSGSGLSGSYFPLNWDIAKKGSQEITIKLRPGFNQNTNVLNETLQPNSEVQIKIVKSSTNKDGSLGDEEEVKNYMTPKKEFQNKQVASYDGLKSFEDHFTFNADVPYTINTLETADVLLTKDEQKLKALEREVVAKYNEIRNVYMKGTKDELASLNYNKEKRVAQQLYFSDKEIKNRWDNDYQFRTDSNLEFFDLKPIENYKMTFYADGKIVCLEKINNEKSALWGGFKKKDKDVVTTTYISLYLYRPKNSGKLEIY
ncbi:hypothetical protein SAMN02787074_0893 [Chryseobacterium sp. YR221]|jgi:hypothetical protein|nr:hypothetical protein SAMN02787074_0893 [Chryseobacterium sp. YR221]